MSIRVHEALVAFPLFVSLSLLAASCSATSGPPMATGAGAAGHRDGGRATAQTQVAHADAEGEKKDDKPKWDVSNPPGPGVDALIDTSEGTWLSLDVSPQGDAIVFDLLGDLYVIPIEGGEATALTTGVAWDMQPRFSPDGASIAYTSDSGGGDNIWIMDRDGSNPRQVSHESFRLLNSPVWDPSGDYIAARKHFTSKRSLGSGEIWLYHRSGGDGVQMNKRPNEQKDLGEPAFSPDGRYLYFSQDVTPGRFFQYNKDSNGQIYAIKRLDRRTGELETYISGAGGSIRPTPSPDGKYVAFIRRVRNQTMLFLHDVESGAEFPIDEHLERDKQEAWAIYGVYPQIAWTPDSGSVVFWAGGVFHRVDIKSKRDRVIPFHVRSTRRVAESVRFPVEVAPDRFDVKMLRWVEKSPGGDSVVFQALGHLYIRDLPDGEPRRLTSQNDRFEMYPSFSRDGRSIVYTTWSDTELGDVRIVSAKGGKGRVVTDKPCQCIEPTFSPDGETIVYRKVAGGYMRSSMWSQEPGVYAVPSKGGESKLVTKTGTAPHFGASNDRLYLLKSEGDETSDTRSLISVDLEGEKERTHFVSEAATEYRVSPDGRWVAFRERWKAYITPFVRAGLPINIGPKSKSVPVATVSTEAGEHLRWSGDSDALSWSLGPDLYSATLEDAFVFLGDKPAKSDDDDDDDDAEAVRTTRTNIGFKADADVPSGVVALVGARLITMQGDKVIERGTIIVDRNRIKAIGPASSTPVPAGAMVIDVKGKTIMPGLIDVHAHGAQGRQGIIPQRNWLGYASLAFGTTTVHDPSNDTDTVFAASEMQRAGLVKGPRLYSTGTILYGAAGADYKAPIDSLDDALFHLRRMKTVGAFSVKSYNQPRREQRQQVIEAARQLRMMVVPEGGSLFEDNMNMVVDGHTGVEHSLPVANIYKDVVDMWRVSDAGYTPTLVVSYGGLSGEYYWYQHTNVWENKRLMRFVPRFIVDPRSRRRLKSPEEEYNHIRVAQGCKKLLDAGVSVQIGAHGQLAGLAAHWEMWMLAQGGMTPMEVIRCATFNGAHYLGLDGDIGSLAKGKLADLLVLDRNPLDDIRNTVQIRYTMLNGRLYDAATMNQVGLHPDSDASEHFDAEQGPVDVGGWWGGSTTISIPGASCVGCSTAGAH